MSKPFGRTQKAILGVGAFGSVTSTVLAAVGILDGSLWVMFNGGLAGAMITALSGGKYLHTKWTGGNNEEPVEPV